MNNFIQILIKLALTLSFLTLSFVIQSQPKFHYPANNNTYAIEKLEGEIMLPKSILQYYYDSTTQQNFAEISSPSFRKLFINEFNWEQADHKTVWVRFSLFNRSNQNGSWLLEIPSTDWVLAYFHSEQGQLTQQQTGVMRTNPMRDYSQSRVPHLKIDIPKSKAVTIYLRLQQQSLPYPTFNWLLKSRAAWEAQKTWENKLGDYITYSCIGIWLIAIVAFFRSTVYKALILLVSGIAFVSYIYLYQQNHLNHHIQLTVEHGLSHLCQIMLLLSFINLKNSTKKWLGVSFFVLRVLLIISILSFTFGAEILNRESLLWTNIAVVLLDAIFTVIWTKLYQRKGIAWVITAYVIITASWIYQLLTLSYSTLILQIVIPISALLISFNLIKRSK